MTRVGTGRHGVGLVSRVSSLNQRFGNVDSRGSRRVYTNLVECLCVG